MLDLICNFVDKSGGLPKVTKTADSLLAVAKSGDVRMLQFMRGVCVNPSAAKMLLAAALLGFRLAALVYERKAKG
jgi:hypothetical protein